MRLNRRYTSQPIGPTSIDWSNPISRDLVMASYAEDSTMFRNMVDGRLATENATVPAFNAFVLSQWGRAKVMRAGSSSNSFRLAGNNLSVAPMRGKMTMVLVCVPKASTTTGRFIVGGGEANGAWNMARIGTTTGDYFIGTQANGATLQSDAPFTMGEMYVVGFTSFAQASPSLGRQRLYVNGVKQTAEGTYAGTNGKVIDNIGIGGSGLPNQADMYAVFAWSRELTPGEMAEISANPYQLFSRELTFKRTANTGPIVTPVNLSPGSKNLGVAGVAPSLSQARNLSVTTSNLPVQGYAPSVAQSVNLALASKNSPVQGYAPSISQASNLSTGVVGLSVIGLAPAVTQFSPNTALTLDDYNLTVAGLAPSVRQAKNLQLGVAPVLVTGLPVIVGHARNVAMVNGALTLTGFAPMVSQGTMYALPAAPVPVNGYAPSVSQAAPKVINPLPAGLKIQTHHIGVSHRRNVALKIVSSGKLRFSNGKLLISSK